MKLLSLAYLIDNPNNLFLVGDKGQFATLEINLIPTDSEGNVLDDDHSIFEEFVDEPKDLFGKSSKWHGKKLCNNIP